MIIVHRRERNDGASYWIEETNYSKGRMVLIDHERTHLEENYRLLKKYYIQIAFEYGCLIWEMHSYETASFWRRLKYLFTKKLSSKNENT